MRKSSIISHQLATCNVQLRNTGDVYYLFTIDMLYSLLHVKQNILSKKTLRARVSTAVIVKCQTQSINQHI